LGGRAFRSAGRIADIVQVTWIQLRSRRDPAVWAPLLLSVVLLVPLVLGTQLWLSDWMERIRALASSDPAAAQAEALRALRLASWSFCAALAGLSAYLFRYFQLGRREGRLPPSGWWSFGAWRAAVGPTARRMSRIGLALSVVLFAAGIGFALAVEHLMRLIRDGKFAD
jgi:hypothetical protein